jgi:hypothetical protein
MRPFVPWVLLALVFLWAIFDEQIGVPLADLNSAAITANDLLAYTALIIACVQIEVRDAAQWVVKQIKANTAE